MLPVSTLSIGFLALSTQIFSPVVALSGDAQQIYTEWKQSSYYYQAVQVVNTVGGTAAGSFSSSTKNGVSGSSSSATEVNVGSFESNETITFPSSSGSTGSSAASASSSASGSTTVTTITETEEQQRFDDALTIITELQELHPHANFSINTPFVLLTSEEFLAYVNRYAIDPNSNPIKAGTNASTSTSTSSTAGMFTTDAEGTNSTTVSGGSGDIMTAAAASGETVDWQKAGCVTAVKDQGECGACWAFSATAAMESGHCVATGSLPNLADQQLISCDSENGNNGCGGGYAAYTMDWVANKRSGKMCTLDTYPFTSDDGNVASCAMGSCTEFDVGVTGYESAREDPGAIEDAVRNQPVSIFLYSGSTAFQYYSGGVLTGGNCDKTGSHSGLAVGFGETDDGVLYWRIKNQWGTSWGEDGYVRVQRRYSGDSEGACGVELYATWPTFDVSATSGSTTSAPSVTTASPSVTTATPSVTTATPSVTTATPSVTTATPSTPSTTSTPSVTTATPTTDTPSATKTVQNVVKQGIEDQTTASSGSDSTDVSDTVDQVAASGSISMYEAVSTESGSTNTVDDTSNTLTETPSATPASASIIQGDRVAGDASYASTAGPGKRDCAM